MYLTPFWTPSVAVLHVETESKLLSDSMSKEPWEHFSIVTSELDLRPFPGWLDETFQLQRWDVTMDSMVAMFRLQVHHLYQIIIQTQTKPPTVRKCFSSFSLKDFFQSGVSTEDWRLTETDKRLSRPPSWTLWHLTSLQCFHPPPRGSHGRLHQSYTKHSSLYSRGNLDSLIAGKRF